MNYRVFPLVPVPIYICKTDFRLNQEENKFLDSLDEIILPGNNFLKNNNQSRILNLMPLQRVKKMFETHLNMYTKVVLQLKNNFVITDTWSTRNPKNSIHKRHSHQNSLFSGVFYVHSEIYNQSGNLNLHLKPQFSKEFNFTYDIENYNEFNSEKWSFSLQTGDIIIFPSYIQHDVSPNELDDDRKIIGFNSFIDGKIGSEKLINQLTIKTVS
jgi:uncharacterized protein (TIGR02466 family)